MTERVCKAADLKDQEAVVIKVNAFVLQQFSDLSEVALFLINVVVRAVVAMRCARHSEMRLGDDFKGLVTLKQFVLNCRSHAILLGSLPAC